MRSSTLSSPSFARPRRAGVLLVGLGSAVAVAAVGAAAAGCGDHRRPQVTTGVAGDPAPVASTSGSTGATKSDPLRVFYVMHLHGFGGRLSGTAPMTQADYLGMAAAVRQLAGVFEAHGARVTFEALQSVVDAAVQFEGPGANLLTELEARGHEVGAHSHVGTAAFSPTEWRETRERLLAAGVQEVTTIGSRVTDLVGDSGVAVAGGAGYSVLTDNLCPVDSRTVAFFPFLVTTPDWGLGGNAGYQDTWCFVHPWRPAVDRGDFNAHDPTGAVIYVDHVTGDWLAGAAVGGLTQTQFAPLYPLLDAALKAGGASGQVTSWGLVSHETEYLGGDALYDPTRPLEPAALAALEAFLTHVDGFGDRVEWVTVRELAREAERRWQ